MSKVLLALTSVALLGLSGCADMQTTQAPPAKAAEPAKLAHQRRSTGCPDCCQG